VGKKWIWTILGLNLVTALIVWGMVNLYNIDLIGVNLDCVGSHDWWGCGGGSWLVMRFIKWYAPWFLITWMFGVIGAIRKWSTKKIVKVCVIAMMLFPYPSWLFAVALYFSFIAR
jgi:hypothetical protein